MSTVYMPFKCSDTRSSYLLRFTATSPDVWEYVDFIDRSGSKYPEGHGDVVAQGTFVPHFNYKGCPDCQNVSFVVCGHCAKLMCYQPQERKWYSLKREKSLCLWCGNTSIIKGEVQNVRGSDDL